MFPTTFFLTRLIVCTQGVFSGSSAAAGCRKIWNGLLLLLLNAKSLLAFKVESDYSSYPISFAYLYALSKLGMNFFEGLFLSFSALKTTKKIEKQCNFQLILTIAKDPPLLDVAAGGMASSIWVGSNEQWSNSHCFWTFFLASL